MAKSAFFFFLFAFFELKNEPLYGVMCDIVDYISGRFVFDAKSVKRENHVHVLSPLQVNLMLEALRKR